MRHDKNKKQKPLLRNLFRPKASPVKEDTWISLSALKKLAKEKERPYSRQIVYMTNFYMINKK